MIINNNSMKRNDCIQDRPILHLNHKTYKFLNRQLATFFIVSPILCISIYLFLGLRMNYWIYEFTSTFISFLLNLLFNLNAQVIIYPEHDIFPSIFIPNHPFDGTYAITINCIAGHIFSFIIGVILLVPSSKVGSIKKEFVWRKIKVLVISTSGIFLLNVFRIVFLLYFNFKGIPFDIIHESLFFLSAVIGALFFFIVLEHWLPELFISIYYLYRLISQKITKKWK